MTPPPPPSAHLARILTRTALPLVLPPSSLPFRASTLALASAFLPAPHTPSQPYTERTIHALYPSPPVADHSSSDWSLKGFLIGNGGKRSKSRDELVALARGQGTARVGGPREKVGPARALVEEWLREGRAEMKRKVLASGLMGEAAYRLGVEERLRYNATSIGLDRVPEALALLAAPRSTPLSKPLELLPFPSPIPHFSHVAHIAQDLAKAAGSEAQGTAWYTLRLRLSLIYTLSELRLVAPSSASPDDRLAEAILFARAAFERSERAGERAEDVRAYGEWVGESWKGLARSAGVV
ncbi:hypothetical protein JCM11251_003644 [Rhodosporidiobolus azoricus]